MNSRAGIALAAFLGALVAGGAAHAERIDCPRHVIYAFAFSDGRPGPNAEPGWSVSLHRVEGERSVSLPKVAVRKGDLVCEYELPNGAFALARLPSPEGSTCVVDQEDIFTLPFFVCE